MSLLELYTNLKVYKALILIVCMIKKIGSEYFIFNKTGSKRLSKGYSSRKKSLVRLREIEYFSNRK